MASVLFLYLLTWSKAQQRVVHLSLMASHFCQAPAWIHRSFSLGLLPPIPATRIVQLHSGHPVFLIACVIFHGFESHHLVELHMTVHWHSCHWPGSWSFCWCRSCFHNRHRRWFPHWLYQLLTTNYPLLWYRCRWICADENLSKCWPGKYHSTGNRGG